jgi:hypothetical protein
LYRSASSYGERVGKTLHRQQDLGLQDIEGLGRGSKPKAVRCSTASRLAGTDQARQCQLRRDR